MNRMRTKWVMSVERGGRCDMCGAPASDMHEIISRGRTVNNERARELSYSKEVCSLLCRECHENAHNPEAQEILLRKNIDRYGYDAVRDVYLAIEDELVSLDIPLPEREDYGG